MPGNTSNDCLGMGCFVGKVKSKWKVIMAGVLEQLGCLQSWNAAEERIVNRYSGGALHRQLTEI